MGFCIAIDIGAALAVKVYKAILPNTIFLIIFFELGYTPPIPPLSPWVSYAEKE